jgi:5-methylcytosine-specific restriction endonuclease McrA
MTLSKLEIQQMLREMNIKFDADETIEALRQRLQQENHNRWLKSVSGSRSTDGRTEKNLVRKRKKEVPAQTPITDPSSESAKPEMSGKPATRPTPDYPHKSEPAYGSPPIEKPAPGKPWKAAADGTEPFNRKKNVFETVLKRARMCCECCGAKTGEGTGDGGLEPYHILPLSQGGEHSIKNVVALCPACREAMEKDPDPKAIKDLKRKTRSKLYDSLQVVRKKKVRTRQGYPRRRK